MKAAIALLIFAQVGQLAQIGTEGPAKVSPKPVVNNVQAVKANEAKKPDTVKITAAPTPVDAVNMAWLDLQTLPVDIQPFQWYVWIPDGDLEKARANSVVFNMVVSKSASIIQPKVVAGGALLRWDISKLLPNPVDLKEFLVLRETKLAVIEPYFTVSLIEKIETLVPGKPTNNSRVKPPPVKKITEVATVGPAPHLFGSELIPGNGVPTLLANATKSAVPVVRHDWIMRILMTTLDKGLYYEFAGIKKAKSVNPETTQSDYAFFLENFFGTDEKAVEKFGGDNRAVMISKITAKWRRVDIFYGRNARPETGLPLVAVTLDLAEGDDKSVDRHPLRNLLNFKDAAKEVIGFKSNGMQLFALFNGAGALQRSAPDNVARDHTVPIPHTSPLQPAISCVRCHGPEGGLQPINNYVSKLLQPGRLNVFDDVSSDKGVKDTIDRLVGSYSGGNFIKALRRARDDYEDAMFLATGGGMGAVEAAAAISVVFNSYNYERVTTQAALLELGFNVPEEQAVSAIRQLLPPVPKGVLGVSNESPLLGALKVNLPILRSDWEAEFTDAALRVKLIREWQAAQEAAAIKAIEDAKAAKIAEEAAKLKAAADAKQAEIDAKAAAAKAKMLEEAEKKADAAEKKLDEAAKKAKAADKLDDSKESAD